MVKFDHLKKQNQKEWNNLLTKETEQNTLSTLTPNCMATHMSLVNVLTLNSEGKLMIV